jgi:hypothetical protein
MQQFCLYSVLMIHTHPFTVQVRSVIMTFLFSGTTFVQFFTISPWLWHVLVVLRKEPVAQNFSWSCKFSPLCNRGIMKISPQFMTLLVGLYLRMYHTKHSMLQWNSHTDCGWNTQTWPPLSDYKHAASQSELALIRYAANPNWRAIVNIHSGLKYLSSKQ